ncbi:hypothetical protein L596_008390 [Steinernema carpocapsae]|nr:hypothetical protein L596_008390 [Steinernema carpocapsae]
MGDSSRSKEVAKKLWELARKPPPHKMDEFKIWFHKCTHPLIKLLKSSDQSILGRLERVVVQELEDSQCIYVKMMNAADKGRVSLPFVFTKLFRFPSIASQFDICQKRTCRVNSMFGSVCINPYHYVLRQAKQLALPAIIMPKLGDTSGAERQYNREDYDSDTCRLMVETDDVIRNGVPNRDLTVEEVEDMNEKPIEIKRQHNEVFIHQTHKDLFYDNDNEGIVLTETCQGVPLADDFGAMEAVEYCYPQVWCSVDYFEETNKLGTTFASLSDTFVIDGYTAPTSTNRFSLGCIPHAKRTPESAACRNMIGAGVRVRDVLGEAWLENLTENSIYVQSPWLNQYYGWHIATILKVPGYCSLKIFNLREFSSALASQVVLGYDLVYVLTRICAVRVSFDCWGTEFNRPALPSRPAGSSCT